MVGGDFPVIEMRRYAIQPGEAATFGACFEAYFPEAFQQLGAIVFGQFVERTDAATFTWFRGYRDIDGRATVNTAFYGGPLWKEHSATMNGRLIDHANVLLLRPATPDAAMPLLPTVDPVFERGGAEGVLVAQIFTVTPGTADKCAAAVEAARDAAADAEVRDAGLLMTLDAPDNFPRLPFRTDGPFVVSLALASGDDAVATGVRPRAEAAAQAAAPFLREAPELIVLDPTPRSRLRWTTTAS